MLDRLIFGTAGLHRLGSAAARQRLLAAVVDVGIRAFDTAPAYGNGIDETEVGNALRGRPGPFAVNTKFGIPVPEYGAWARHLFAVRRAADKLSGASAAGYRRRDFSREELVRSVERSLRRLAPQAIDVLLIHEPLDALPDGAVEEILDSAARLEEAGKIRRIGIAGTAASIARFPSLARLDLVQTRAADRGSVKGWAPPRPMVLYGTYDAFRSEGAGRTYPAFLRALLEQGPGTRAIVATGQTSRVAELAGIVA